jgi:hypothetical protein
MDDPRPTNGEGLLTCPTPISARRPLIAHRITPAVCEMRQAGQYHKCFSCVNSALQHARERESFRERTALAEEPAPILQGPGSPARAPGREAVRPASPVEELARALSRL